MMKKYLTFFTFLLFSLFLFGQTQVTIKGVVTDQQTRSQISGVSIRSQTTGRALGVSDDKGRFKIRTSPDEPLIFTYTGYSSVTETIAGRTFLNIEMFKEDKMIEEVVIQGFAQRSRETLTGSSISLSGDKLQDVPAANVTELLQGKVAGLNIQNTTGMPGARGSMMMRGLSNISTIGGGDDAFLTPTSPLFVIDGVPVDDNTNYEYGFHGGGPGISPLSLIPPEDIESIDFLKDAAATSLYGSRGAYGVMIITTKRGKSKTPIIQYQTQQYFNFAPALRPVIGGHGERMLRIDQVLANDESIYTGRDKVYDNAMLSDSLNPYFNNSTNWQSVFYGTTYNQTHTVSASGGDNTFNYKVNTSLFDDKGIIKNTGFRRYTLSMNSEFRPNERFRMFVSTSGVVAEQQKGSGNGVTQTGVANAASASSLLPSVSSAVISPDILGALNNRNDNRTTDLRSSIDLRYEMVKGVFASNSFSYNYTTGREENFIPALANNNTSQVYLYDARTSKLYNRFQLEYLREFGKDNAHMIQSYVFNELDATDFDPKAQQTVGTPNDQYEGPFGYNIGAGLGGKLNPNQYRSAAFAGNISYNYLRKYVFDFSYRYDKQSTTGPDAAWSQSPALSARWNIDKENFMSEVYWVDNLALRASWGKNIVPTGTIFDANGKYVYTGRFNNSQTIGFNWTQMPNSMLTPQVTTQWSGALEMGLFNGRVTTIQELYYKQVDGQLWKKTLADHNVFEYVQGNDVSFVNYGYEFTFTFRPLSQGSKLNWTLGLVGAINHDKLAQLTGASREYLHYDDQTKQHTLYRLGRNVFSHVLYHYRGVFSTDDDVPVNPVTNERYKMVTDNGTYYFQAGDPYWTDLNGDYILDERDLVYVGNSQPKFTGGFNTYFAYKGLTLNANFSLTLKRDILNNALASQLSSYRDPLNQDKNYTDNGLKNASRFPNGQYDFWMQPGDEAKYPYPYHFNRQISPFRYNQTLFLEEGSYLKVNNITLGYNIPREITQRYSITSLRFYVTGNNIYTFSRYSGPDPENVTDMGRDRSDGYPNRRSFTVGLNMQF